MTTSDFRYGFRIVGKTCEPRRLVDAGAAFAAYAACDPRAECEREAYLSAFRFAADFRRPPESDRLDGGLRRAVLVPVALVGHRRRRIAVCP